MSNPVIFNHENVGTLTEAPVIPIKLGSLSSLSPNIALTANLARGYPVDLLTNGTRVHENKVRVRAIGHREMLPKHVIEAIEYAENKTKDYSDYNYNLAIAYGGRQEIVRSMEKIAKKIESGEVSSSQIDANLISDNLYTNDLPDPDLILRTSGEERISNFLLWQLAYSELYFSDVFWPDMRKIDFLRAIRSFQQRKRRLGL